MTVRTLRHTAAAALFALAPYAASAACIYDGVNAFICSGNVGAVTLIGSAGDDTFRFLDGTTGSVQIVSGGQATHDTLDLSTFAVGVSVDASSGALQTVAPGLQMQLSGFTRVRLLGGQGADTLVGTAGDDLLQGGPGADAIDGGAGTDRRTDSTPADCTGDTLTRVETDACLAPAAGAPQAVPAVGTVGLFALAALLGAAGRRRLRKPAQGARR